MATNFITNTASLKTTIADVRKLNAKKIFVGGENILDIINRATPTIAIKHSQDTRTTVTEDDLWGQWVETKSDGTIVVHDDWITNPNNSNYSAWNSSITKVGNNKAYVGDTLFGNIQSEKMKDGYSMFSSCANLTIFTSDLSSLTNGSSMFYKCTALTSFSSDLSSLTNGTQMFYQCTALTSFSSDLSSLTNGSSMFYYCSKLKSFNSDSSGSPVNLSSLTNGSSMFYYCSALTAFTSDLSSLTYGFHMFYNCSALTTFTSDLSSLTNGSKMFNYCTKLTTFTSDSSGSPVNLSSLTQGGSMFANCSNLTIFTSDLSTLTTGQSMFYNCTKLTTFASDLSSLINGYMMFYKTKLTPQSVMYIVDSIKDIVAEKKLYQDGIIPYVTYSNGKYSATKGFMTDGSYVYTYNNPQPHIQLNPASNIGNLHLGINVTNNANTILDQLQAFAEEATFDSWEDLKQAFVDKGWNVTWQYGGTNTSFTYGLSGGEQIIPCQIFAKLIEADKDSAEYCTEDAASFYNIEWGHDVPDTSSYTQFNSLEDAMASWNVFPKENIIRTEE